MLTAFGSKPTGSLVAYAPLLCCSILAILIGRFAKTTSWYGRNQVALWSLIGPLVTLLAAGLSEKIGDDVGYATVLLMIFAGLGSDRILGWFPIPAVRLLSALCLQAATMSFVSTAYGRCALHVRKLPIEDTSILHEVVKAQTTLPKASPLPLHPLPPP